MNPALIREIETILQESPAPVRLKCQKPLAVAACMLSQAAAHQMTATTVVGVLGGDDVDAFRALVSGIAAEYGLEARVKIQLGSYSVRFSRCPEMVQNLLRLAGAGDVDVHVVADRDKRAP